MKTKKEVLAFLDDKKGKTITDELAIEAYCARRKIKILFTSHQTQKQEITFTQFEQWFNRIVPVKHSIIIFPDSGVVGLVKNIEPSHVVFAAHIASDGKFVHKDKKFPITPFKKAKSTDVLRLQYEFYKHNLIWNKHYSIIQKSIKLKDNLLVRVSLLGKKKGLGVFKEIDSSGQVIMYVYYELGKEVRFSLHEAIGKVQNFQFDELNMTERKILNEELCKKGKIWNGHQIRIEPIEIRVAKKDKYYYIDNSLIIREVTEMNKQKDCRHSRCGNYFRTYDKAKILLKKACDFLKDFENYTKSDRKRVVEGEMYYYVDEYLIVRKVVDNYKPTDMEQFKSGNYFKNNADAVKLLGEMVNGIKIIMSQPEVPAPPKKK